MSDDPMQRDAMLSDHSVWRLASAHWLRNLRHLTLSVRQGNIDGARPLMDALRGGKLQTLSLRGSHGALNDAATWAPKLDLRLKSLNVEGCGLQDDAFEALLGSPALAQIEDLRFWKSCCERGGFGLNRLEYDELPVGCRA